MSGPLSRLWDLGLDHPWLALAFLVFVILITRLATRGP
jgi:hypothetical protein